MRAEDFDMASDTVQQTKQAVEKPVISWRQRVIAAGAIVSKPWRRYRAALFQGYLAIAIIVFAILAVLAHTVAYFTFDLSITRAIQTVNAGWFSSLMQLISWFGFAPQVMLVTAIFILFLLLTGLRWETAVTLISVIGISVIGFVVKALVVRPRPSPNLVHVLATIKDYSFPSGHVLYYVAFFGFLLFLSFVLVRPLGLRLALILVFGSLVSLVGISRIYEGEHWASDVLGAYLLATFWLALMARLYDWGKTRFFVHQPIAKPVGKDRPT